MKKRTIDVAARMLWRVAAVFAMAVLPSSAMANTDDGAALAERRHYERAVLALAQSPRPSVRQRVAHLVGGFDSPEARETLASLLAETEQPGIVAQAIKGLAWSASAPRASRAADYIDSPNADIRSAAYRVLLIHSDGGDVSPFVRGMADSDSAVRRLALMGLAAHPSREGDALLRRALEDGGVDAAIRTLRALTAAKTGRFDDLLMRLADHEQSAVRGMAAAALGTVHENRRAAVIDTVRERLDDGHPYVRRMAAWSVFSLKDGGALDDLVARLADSDFGVRETAAELLGRIDAPGSLEALYSQIDDPSLHVRIAAGRSLAGLLKPANAAMAKRLLDTDLQLAVPANADAGFAAFRRMNTAIRALGLAHYGEAQQRLYALANSHPNANVRGAALVAIVEMNLPDPLARGWSQPDPQAIGEYLMPLMGRHPDPVRSAAIAGLARLNHRQAIPALTRISGNMYDSMMAQAGVALQYMETKDIRAVQGFEEDYTGFPAVTQSWLPHRDNPPQPPSDEDFANALRSTIELGRRGALLPEE